MGLYIFEDREDFLRAIDELNEMYNSQRDDYHYLHIHLDNVFEARSEIKFLKRCHIIAYSTFRRDSLIKVSLTDSKGDKFNITYSFNNSHVPVTAFGEIYNFLKRCLS